MSIIVFVLLIVVCVLQLVVLGLLWHFYRQFDWLDSVIRDRWSLGHCR